jgi:hypothetical protein
LAIFRQNEPNKNGMENESHKRVIGKVVQTREVKPRKRIRRVVDPAMAEKRAPDYEKAFKSLYRAVLERDLLAGVAQVCAVCRDVADHNDGWSGWDSCAHCGQDLCPECLPPHKTDEADCVMNVFYCLDCTDKLREDTQDAEPGYTIMNVCIGGVMGLASQLGEGGDDIEASVPDFFSDRQ